MPSLTLPERFKSAPFFGNYYTILGLSNTSPTMAQIKAGYNTMALQFHPDKINTSSIQPPLSYEEATECFKALSEIKSVLLASCPEVIAQGANAPTTSNFRSASEGSKIRSAADLTPGEQLKAVMVAYMRSERFCEYSAGKGPSAPGYWCYIPDGQYGIEIGRSKYSNKIAIATNDYQVEIDVWNEPVTVFNKQERPFKQVSDPLMIHKILTTLANFIPIDNRDHSAKIYGSAVREKLVLEAKPIQAPYEILDSQGNNYVDGIRKNLDQSFTILGRNFSGQPREITLYQDGEVLGFNRSKELGVVGTQFFENREEIFQHFDLELSQEIPCHSQKRLGY